MNWPNIFPAFLKLDGFFGTGLNFYILQTKAIFPLCNIMAEKNVLMRGWERGWGECPDRNIKILKHFVTSPSKSTSHSSLLTLNPQKPHFGFRWDHNSTRRIWRELIVLLNTLFCFFNKKKEWSLQAPGMRKCDKKEWNEEEREEPLLVLSVANLGQTFWKKC